MSNIYRHAPRHGGSFASSFPDLEPFASADEFRACLLHPLWTCSSSDGAAFRKAVMIKARGIPGFDDTPTPGPEVKSREAVATLKRLMTPKEQGFGIQPRED